MQLDKLTEKSREALQAANTLAENWTNPEIEPEHLAVALLDQADGTAAPLLQAVGADPARLKQDFSRELSRFPRVQGDAAQIGLSRRSQKILRGAQHDYSVAHCTKRTRSDSSEGGRSDCQAI